MATRRSLEIATPARWQIVHGLTIIWHIIAQFQLKICSSSENII
jgi:hypothetical protein